MTITGLSSGPDGTLWAVGNSYDGSAYTPFAAEWSGTAWVPLPPEVPVPADPESLDPRRIRKPLCLSHFATMLQPMSLVRHSQCP